MGEYLSAEACDYTDCKGFQLICAGTCKEPIFKVVRKLSGKEVHYFSHYKESTADPLYQECELRVKALSRDVIGQTAKTARGQRLELFMRVFQGEIWRIHFSDWDSIQNAQSTLFRRIVHTATINDFLAGYKRHLYENKFCYAQIMEAIDDYLKDKREVGGDPYPTELRLETQRRITWDLYEHLLSKPAKDTLNFLTRFAFMFLVSRISQGLADVPVSAEELEKAKRLNFVVKELFLGRWQMRDFVESEFEGMLPKFAAEIFHESIGVLLRVDWIKILERHLAQNSAAPA